MTIYDLAPLHFPEWSHRRTRRLHGRSYRGDEACGRGVRDLGVHTAKDVSSGSGSRRTSRIPASISGTRRTGARGRRRTCSRSARASRARTSTCSTGSACASSTTSPTSELPRLYRGRVCVRLPVPLRRVRDAGRRGDGVRDARRLLEPCVARRGGGRRRRARRLEDPAGRSRRGSTRRASGATSSSRGVSSTRARFTWRVDRRGDAARVPRGGRMKVALDVSPLRLTRAGSARYVEGLRRELPEHVELRELAWGGSGRATRRAAGRCLVSARAPARRAPRGRPPLPDVSRAVRGLRPARRHSARPRRAAAPELFNRWNAPTADVTVPRVVRAARRADRDLGVHEARGRRAARRRPRRGSR